MNVLHLIYDHRRNPWVGGGGAVRAHEVNRRLAGRGVAVRCICGSYPGAPRKATEGGVEYEFVGAARPYAWSRWTYARAATRALAERSYDIAVLDFSAYTPLRLPPRGSRARIVAVVHHVTGFSAKNRWGALLGGWIDREETRRLRQFRWISADSEHTLEEVRKRVRPETEVRLIGNAVDDRLFALRWNEAEPPYFLYLGRLDIFHKGLDTLISAFERYCAASGLATLRIAGRGKDAGRLAELVTGSPAADRIQILGSVSEEEKHALLAGARAVVMPSRLEGWGMVAAEAMAAGVPLIASTAGSLPEITGGDAGAFLVPPADVERLHDALRRLETDTQLRQSLAVRGRTEAVRRFSWDVIAEEHYRFLLQVAASA